jgi:hypothetical protein
MDRDVAAVYDFCSELLTTKRVSDATLQSARAVLGGDRGVIDLVGTLGAYQLVAMMMVVDEFPLPDGVARELASGPHQREEYREQRASTTIFPAATTERPVVVLEGRTIK